MILGVRANWRSQQRKLRGLLCAVLLGLFSMADARAGSSSNSEFKTDHRPRYLILTPSERQLNSELEYREDADLRRFAETWNLIGRCELRLAKMQSHGERKQEHVLRARDAFEEAKHLKPESKDAAYGLAETLETMGLINDAQVAWECALALESDPVVRAKVHTHLQQMSGIGSLLE